MCRRRRCFEWTEIRGLSNKEGRTYRLQVDRSRCLARCLRKEGDTHLNDAVSRENCTVSDEALSRHLALPLHSSKRMHFHA